MIRRQHVIVAAARAPDAVALPPRRSRGRAAKSGRMQRFDPGEGSTPATAP
jgi:hypothetical protein